jgi:hypothetical protein
MELNKRTIGSLLYRKRRIDAQFDMIRDQISGRSNSYTEGLMNKNGTFSAKKTDKMIDSILDCLKQYRAYNIAQEEGAAADMLAVPFSDAEESFYKSYIYLLIGLGMEYHNGPNQRFIPVGTYNAILEVHSLNSYMEYHDQAELDRDLLWDYEIQYPIKNDVMRIPEGFFYDVCRAYDIAVGGNLTALFTDKERENALALLTESERETLEEMAKDPSYVTRKADEDQAELDAMLDELEPDDFEFPPIEEIYAEENGGVYGDGYYDELMMNNDVREEDRGLWALYFADHERLCESINAVRRGMLDQSVHGDLKKEIPIAVELYLEKEGISKWVSDDFFTAYTYVDRVNRLCAKRFQGK